MSKLSKVYEKRGYSFRYDYDHAVVKLVSKASEDDLELNQKWTEKNGRPLFDIDEDEYIECDSVGLSRENWDDKEAREEYLDGWIDEFEEEVSYLAAEFLTYG